MKQKTMKLWQMIMVLVLSLVMAVTMFLPAFRINGDAVKKMTEDMTSGNALTELIQGYVMDGMDEQFKEMDEAIEEYEKESNVKISKISPFRIMTHSLAKLIAGDKATEEEILKKESDEIFGQIQKGYNKLRYLLWAVYALLLVTIIIIVLGFLLKWNKIVPFVISAVYGLAAAGIFGYLRFGLMRSLAKKAGDAIMDVFMGGSGVVVSEEGTSVLAKAFAAFYSVAFMIAFIAALCMIAASILSIFLGNKAAGESLEPENYPVNDGPGVFPNGSVNPFGETPGQEHNVPTQPGEFPFTPVQPASSVQPVTPAPVPAPASMGQVKCSKGVMAGQGLMLPQDRKIIVGKSPQKANMVINNQNVSNIHCSIRYNAATNTYTVKDHSTNGTFVNGARLPKGQPLEFPAGTVLKLADGSNEITLG